MSAAKIGWRAVFLTYDRPRKLPSFDIDHTQRTFSHMRQNIVQVYVGM
jgi:hypothetical protein